MSLDSPIGPDMLRLLDATHLFDLLLLALFHHALSHDELLKHLLLGVLSPSQPCFPQIAVLEAKEELLSSLDGAIIEVPLASRRSDPLEHLPPQSLPGNRTDCIDCILLFADVGDPFEEDILELGHVNVASLAVLERGESRPEILLDLVTALRRRVQLLGECLDLCGLLLASLIASMDQITTLVHLILILGVQLALNRIVMLLCPGAECPLQLILHPVD